MFFLTGFPMCMMYEVLLYLLLFSCLHLFFLLCPIFYIYSSHCLNSLHFALTPDLGARPGMKQRNNVARNVCTLVSGPIGVNVLVLGHFI